MRGSGRVIKYLFPVYGIPVVRGRKEGRKEGKKEGREREMDGKTWFNTHVLDELEQ